MASNKKNEKNKSLSIEEKLQYWNLIEKRAFSPEKDQIGAWLRNFLRFVESLFEKEPTFSQKVEYRRNGFQKKISFDPAGITCDFWIPTDLSKFSFTIQWEEHSFFRFDYNNECFCEFDYLKNNYIKKLNLGKGELESLLESKIHHPALHLHLERVGEEMEKTDAKKLDEVRIGVATANPFLFLYQVAYQALYFLGEGQKQKEEFKRMVNVIFENKDIPTISPGILLRWR